MDILASVMDWALASDPVRVILMVGSRAHPGMADELSDYDLSIFGGPFDYIVTDEWLEAIYPHILCIHEAFDWDRTSVPTRLTIFENFAKVDFSFHPMELLEEMIHPGVLTATYDSGYAVVLDKDGKTQMLPKPRFQSYTIRIPEEPAFREAVREFWFESYHVAKYLSRGDWWVAGTRDHDMKKWLLRILQWNAVAHAGSPLPARPDGKNMKHWIRKEWFDRLPGCFTGWNGAAQWVALRATANLFAEVSRETASLAGWNHSEDIEGRMMKFFDQLNKVTDGSAGIKSL